MFARMKFTQAFEDLFREEEGIEAGQTASTSS
jgi:hypothetical protein